ncbi:hypothetical protein KKH16_00220 [Patescibacteria group bacterium]|nr:hypothetical protein [Patescibacteria group bacterium]
MNKKDQILNSLLKNAFKIWAFFLDLIFPIECVNCNCEEKWLCQTCFNTIKLRHFQVCLACKQKTIFGKFCSHCAPNYKLDGVLIASYYNQEIVDKLIKNFKYYFVKDLSQDLAKILILFLNDLLDKNKKIHSQAGLTNSLLTNFSNNLIIPVPLSAYRQRWRDFNQAELIARLIAQNFNLELSINQLIRKKHTKPQVKLNKIKRKINVKGCFDWQADDLAGRQIILIDDVVTTGATLNECAKVLKYHGASKVWALALANG